MQEASLQAPHKEKITLLNVDCMQYMAGLPDNAFDLAIVDPPYFDVSEDKNYLSPGSKISTTGVNRHTADFKTWKKPTKEYFVELFRISKHQIIWGSNYYIGIELPVGRIVWDKQCDESSFGDGEIAVCSMIKTTRFFRFRWNGMLQGDMKNKELRIHPNQKPAKLYEWILTNYAKPGQRIIDTHLGSGSSAIAAHNLGFDFVGMELDKDYFDAACARLKAHQAQQTLFAPEVVKYEQVDAFE
jgi:site-specific DNA-methyltransferase (adenine-specific)